MGKYPRKKRGGGRNGTPYRSVGGGEVKPAVKLWDLIKPPFRKDGTLHIFDRNNFMCGMVRGWGALQDYENGAAVQDELQQFMIDAMNEKFERVKEAEHETGD
jgi:hypothetical protein